MATKWVIIAGVLAFAYFSLVLSVINPTLGQELLPEIGSNQSIGNPNMNVNVTENNIDIPTEPGSILDPFFGR